VLLGRKISLDFSFSSFLFIKEKKRTSTGFGELSFTWANGNQYLARVPSLGYKRQIWTQYLPFKSSFAQLMMGNTKKNVQRFAVPKVGLHPNLNLWQITCDL